MKQTVEEAAKQELTSSYAIIVEGELAYHRQAMLNMFRKGYEWQSKQSPWIRAKDQLPPVDEEDISEQSEPVLVKISGHCEPEILVYNKYYHVGTLRIVMIIHVIYLMMICGCLSRLSMTYSKQTRMC